MTAIGVMIVGTSFGQKKVLNRQQIKDAVKKETKTTQKDQTTQRDNRSGSSSSNTNKTASIRSVLQKYENSDSVAELTRTVNEAASPQYIIAGGDLLELRSEKIDVTDQPSTELFCNEGTSLYPGCLVYVNSDLRDGNATPITSFGYGRVKVTLDIDTGGKNSVEAENSYSGIQEAIRTLVRQAYSSGYHQPARSGYISEDYTSNQKMAIDVGCDVNYAGAKLKASTSTTTSNSKITHFEDLSMIYYTVHVEPLNGDITSLFGSNTTAEQVENAMKKYHLAYVSDMSYGCRIYHFTDYEASDFKFSASVDASYMGSSVNSKSDITKNTTNKKERLFVYGGPQGIVSGMTENEATVKSTLKKVTDKTGFNISAQNQGLPLSLKTVFVASGRLCQRHTSGSYYDVKYVKHPKVVTLRVSTAVDGVAGSRVKPKFMYRTLTVNNGKITRNTTLHTYEKEFGGNGSSIKKSWSISVPLASNEYIDGNIYFGVRRKPYSGKDWQQAIEGYVDPVACGGDVNIQVKGDTRSKVYVGGNSPVGLINQAKGKY